VGLRWFGPGKGRPAVEDVPGAIRQALESALAGDTEGVETALTQVVQADSSDVGAYLGLVGVYRDRGELGRAISLAQTLVLRPELSQQEAVRARLALASCFRAGGFAARSIEVFEEVLAGDRRNPIALRALSELMAENGSFSTALSFLRRWSKVEGVSSRREEAELWLRSADQAESAGDSEGARRALRRALRRDADYGLAHLRLGESERQRGRAKSAARSLLRAVALDAALAEEAYAGLELCRPELRRKGAYEALLRKRLNEEADDMGARVALARHLLAEGRVGESIRELRGVVSEFPENTAALVVHLRAPLSLPPKTNGAEELLKACTQFLDELDLRLSREGSRIGGSP